MNINYLLILGCLLTPFFHSCSDTQQEDEVCIEPVASAINPNGDSELALLMRQMYYDADSIKQNIINDNGNVTDEFITALEKVHTANPTDPNVKTPEFEAFNKLIITQAKATQADVNDKISGFNAIVSRCIDCHQSFCPGPIVRIKKLEIPTE